MLAAAACSLFGSEEATLADAGFDEGVERSGAAGGGPVVEMLPPRIAALPPLDPNADPGTPLGELRSRYFPVWTSDFDAAFPPQACGSAWELDAIAEPVADVNVSLYGNAPTMAALAVMRYEHLVSRALAHPSPLAQLCVAVGSVDPARAEVLQHLGARLDGDGVGEAPVGFPPEVTILAASPTAMLAVACVGPDAWEAVPGVDGAAAGPPQARLSAYLLLIAQGREDQVVDVSYRVSRAYSRVADGCSGAAEWAAEWDQQVQTWIAEGQAWVPHRVTLSAEAQCASPPAEGPQECPATWAR